MSHSLVIETNALSYSFSKEVKTLVDINLQVEQGSIYGFLGPNGSGKTTTLSLLLGLLKMQQGRIKIFGQELQSNRINVLKRIGSFIETPSLYEHLTAKENLEIYRPIYKVAKERIVEVLQITGLNDIGSKVVKKFSQGMKQRLAIALALLPHPELLILDEPTNGLDPNGIIELRELIIRLNKEGITILISSHILAEVERMVSHIGIISKGHLLFQGSIQELYLLQQIDAQLMIRTSDDLAALNILHHYQPKLTESGLSVSYDDMGQVAAINRTLIHNELDVFLLQPKEQNLEQLFIHLTSASL